MLYRLENATIQNIDLLIKYKLNTIFEYATDLSLEESNKIHNYVNKQVSKDIKKYKFIKIENKIIGCVLVKQYLDGVILDEIFIEDEYRNLKIGTRIISDVLSANPIVYLWVYKDNTKAFKLYKKLGFNIIEETESRYFMKYSCK